MFGCVYFIQSRNSWLLFIDQQSNNQTIFLFSCNLSWVIWMCKYGNRILWTYYFVVSNVYQWFSLKVNSQLEFMHLSSPSIDGGRHLGVILVNTILLGSKTLFVIKDTTKMTSPLSSTPNVWMCFVPLFSQVIYHATGMRWTPFWSLFTTWAIGIL